MITLQFKDEISNYSLILDDDGKVTYVYLLTADGTIISDVWLYNIVYTPVAPEWRYTDKAPFLNPVEFVKNETIKPIEKDSEIQIKWVNDGNILKRVEVFLYGELFAILIPHEKPGWSKLAKKNGPLARTMRDFESLK